MSSIQHRDWLQDGVAYIRSKHTCSCDAVNILEMVMRQKRGQSVPASPSPGRLIWIRTLPPSHCQQLSQRIGPHLSQRSTSSSIKLHIHGGDCPFGVKDGEDVPAADVVRITSLVQGSTVIDGLCLLAAGHRALRIASWLSVSRQRVVKAQLGVSVGGFTVIASQRDGRAGARGLAVAVDASKYCITRAATRRATTVLGRLQFP
ncbi:hypothetical protein CALCODRAFT_200726 [Calocera cornea HHB12733]|uniref:Uncharacterized protein n=1 Tax=Calocera cornea HHB12733 TaxID=1353952 RepID=A0A165HHD4_9BASI|nr:hypothetical protein CALCODRAFT_200726 [Calocera cornea HHB12733]